MTHKQKLIQDIQHLLNNYEGVQQTSINPALLEFMDEKTLISIIDDLLTQKEQHIDSSDLEWLNKFKKVT